MNHFCVYSSLRKTVEQFSEEIGWCTVLTLLGEVLLLHK